MRSYHILLRGRYNGRSYFGRWVRRSASVFECSSEQKAASANEIERVAKSLPQDELVANKKRIFPLRQRP